MHGSPRAGAGGLALKAADPIRKGSLVIMMNVRTLATVHSRDADAFTAARGLPHDGGIHFRARGVQIFVTDWQPGQARPTWYLLNHAPRTVCNLDLVFNKDTRGFEWYAREDIASGTELTFAYGEPQKGWV